MDTRVRTSVELISQAVRDGRAVTQLADGEPHVLAGAELAQHGCPDIICSHEGCLTVFDSLRLAWVNGQDRTTNIKRRDNWRPGLCPDHC